MKKTKKKPISCTWVYKLKPPTTLNPEPIFKARLCAHGFKQREGIDYSSTFAQVATLKAFRILLWLSVFLKYRCTQMDVESAFLAGKLDKEICMSPPAGYEEIGNVVLIKSIYGLKQAPRIWYHTLVQALHSLGFKELITDSCVFKHTTSNCYLLVFVDDIICVTNDEDFRTQVETKLQNIFDIKILGTLRHFIGIQIDIDEMVLYISTKVTMYRNFLMFSRTSSLTGLAKSMLLVILLSSLPLNSKPVNKTRIGNKTRQRNNDKVMFRSSSK